MTRTLPRSSARRLFTAVGMYGLAFLAPRLLRFAVIPPLVAALGFQAYGTFVLVSLAIPIVHVVCELGMGTAALRIAPHEPPERRGSVFASVVVARVATGVVASILLYVGRSAVARLLTGSTDAATAVGITAVTLFVFTQTTAFADQLRSDERHATLARLDVVRDVVEAAASCVLVLLLRGGLLGLLSARLLTEVAFLGLLAVACRSTFRSRASLAMVAQLARLGIPIAVFYLFVCLRDLDRYLIGSVLGVEQAGRYDLALRIVAPVALANAALVMVFEPHAFRTFRSPAAGPTIAVFLRVYVVVFGTMAFSAAVVAPEVFPLLSPGARADAAVISPVLLFAFVADGVLRVAGLGADFAKRTFVWMVAAGVHLAVALPATWLLMRPLGILGAGSALLGGTLAAVEAAYALARRFHPLRLPVHRALAAIVLGVCGSTYLLGGWGAIAPVALRLAAIPVFAALAWPLVGLRYREAVAALGEAGIEPAEGPADPSTIAMSKR